VVICVEIVEKALRILELGLSISTSKLWAVGLLDLGLKT